MQRGDGGGSERRRTERVASRGTRSGGRVLLYTVWRERNESRDVNKLAQGFEDAREQRSPSESEVLISDDQTYLSGFEVSVIAN